MIQLFTNQLDMTRAVPTVAKTKAFAARVCVDQQNEYDTNSGPKLLMAARDGDASRLPLAMAMHRFLFPPSEISLCFVQEHN